MPLSLVCQQITGNQPITQTHSCAFTHPSQDKFVSRVFRWSFSISVELQTNVSHDIQTAFFTEATKISSFLKRGTLCRRTILENVQVSGCARPELCSVLLTCSQILCPLSSSVSVATLGGYVLVDQIPDGKQSEGRRGLFLFMIWELGTWGKLDSGT